MAQRGFRLPWGRQSRAADTLADRAEPQDGGAVLHFLGTAAALPSTDRANSMLSIVEAGQPGLLIDCGAGVVQGLMRAGIAPDTIRDILITHAHIDHSGNLPSLLESWRISGRTAPVRVYATAETMPTIERLLDLFSFELTLDSWPFEVELVRVAPGEVRLGAYAAQIVPMDHAVPSVGVRLDLPGGPLAYTCDTQPNPNVSPLAEGVRTLITECTFLSDQTPMARLSRHLTAREVGQIAQEAGVSRLAVVHLGVGEAPNFLERVRAEISENYKGPLIIPNDGDTLRV